MASVTLDKVRIGLVSDLAGQISVDAASIGESSAVPGDVRVYANGRLRTVVRAGKRRAVPLKLWVADRTQLDLVLSWVGQTVLYRDPRGRKMYGVFFEAQVDENIGAVLAGVSLTLSEVTVSEAV